MEHPTNAQKPTARWEWAAMALTLLIALALRVATIGGESAWYDEVISLRVLDAPSLATFWAALAVSDPPVTVAPVYFTLEYYWGRVFGTGVLTMRMLSVVMGLAAMALLWRLGRRLAGPSAALVAALLFALSLSQIYYSQEIRMYALVVLLALAAMWSLLRINDTGQTRWYLLGFVLNGLLLFTHVFAVLLVAVEVLWLLTGPRKRAAMAWGAAHALWVGLFALAYAWLEPPNALWMPPSGWRELVNAYIVFAGGRYGNDNPAAYVLPAAPWLAQAVELVVIGACAGGVVAAALRLLWGEGRRDKDTLLLLWAVLPPCVLWLASVLWHPCFLYRYLLYVAPALHLLTGRLIAPPKGPPRWWAAALISAAMAFQGQVVFTHTFRPGYEAVARAAYTGHTQHDVPLLVVKEPLNTAPLRYYAPGLAQAITPLHSGRDIPGKVLEMLEEHSAVNVVIWRWENAEKLIPEGVERVTPPWREPVTTWGMPPLAFWTLHRVPTPAD